MKIQIMGPGCQRCEMTYKNAQMAVIELGITADVEKVTKLDEMAKFGIMFTPALVVDGQVKVAGKVPTVEEVKRLLSK